MNEKKGWIKLYRKSLDSWVWKDQVAWRIFSWIILMADHKTALVRVSKYRTAREVGMPSSTFYKGIKRLEREGIIEILGATRGTTKHQNFTVIHIAKFAQYQGTISNEVSKLSTSYPQSGNYLGNTKQEEQRITTREILKIENGKTEDRTTDILRMKELFFTNHVIAD